MRSIRSSLLAFALLAVATMTAPAGAQETLPRSVVVDKVVAFVGSRPITLSEVELELRLGRAAGGDIAGATGSVSLDDLALALPPLIDQTVVLRAMRSQYTDTLEPGLAEAELIRMRASFGTAEAWAAFLVKLELSEEEVRERRRRVLEAASILKLAVAESFNVRSDELEKHIEANPGMTREQAEEALLAANESDLRRELLDRKKKDVQAAVVDWIVAERGVTGAPD